MATVIDFFINIAFELTVLFIGVTFLVGLRGPIHEYVSDETVKRALSGRNVVAGSVLAATLGTLSRFAPAQQYRCFLVCSMPECHLQLA